MMLTLAALRKHSINLALLFLSIYLHHGCLKACLATVCSRLLQEVKEELVQEARSGRKRMVLADRPCTKA
jgi:hypothetical protein